MLFTQEYLFWGNAEGAESEILVPSNAQSPSQVGEIKKKRRKRNMWVITNNLLEQNFVHICSKDYKENFKFKLTKKFRLLDGDDNIYFEGLSDNINFDPLDDWGMPFYGCTTIEYYEDDKWVVL